MIDENRLIDDLIKCRELGRKSCEIVGKIIRNRPKVGTLIPCEERLPENFQDVLVLYKARIDGGTHDGEEISDFGIGYVIGKEWTVRATKHIKQNTQIAIAWMPLPNKYED